MKKSAQDWDPDLMPDFLVIGAGKSGTTSLNEYLRQHPDVFMCRKEPNFFAFEMHTADDFDDPVDRAYYYQAAHTLEQYQELWKNARKDQLKGDVSNTYMTHDPAYARIKHYVPEVKMIALLRHPAERLFSRYAHIEREGEVTDELAVDRLWDRNSLWWRRPDLVPEGFYYRQLAPYFEHFKREQFRIYLYEEFTQDTERVFREILRFLDLRTDVDIDTGVVYNKTGKVKSPLLHKLVGPNSLPIRMVKKILPVPVKETSWTLALRNRVHNLRSANLTKTEIPAEIKSRVTQEIYRDDLVKLEELIQKDLTAWLDY